MHIHQSIKLKKTDDYLFILFTLQSIKIKETDRWATLTGYLLIYVTISPLI